MNKSWTGDPNRVVLLFFLVVALYASYVLVKPFIEPIVLAILIGMLAQAPHDWLLARLKGRRDLTALISLLLLFMVVLTPVLLLLLAVIQQGIGYSIIVRDWATVENIRELLSHPWVLEVQSRLSQVLPEGALDPDTLREQALGAAGTMGKGLADVSTAMIGSVTRFFIHLLLFLFVLFFVLRDHDKLIEFIRHALPLSRSQEDILFKEVKDVSKSALMGSLMTAATQGVVGGFGLWMAGFPGVFWGAVMAFTSLIPVVGTALVWLPAAAFLALTGQVGWAIFMVIWGVIVVGSIDNFLRPMFMQGSSLSTVVVFFSLIGGLQVYGLMGMIYGPLVFSLALVLFRLYETEFADFLASQDER